MTQQQDNLGIVMAITKYIAPWARTFIACAAALTACAHYLGVPRLVDAYSASVTARTEQDERIDKLLSSLTKTDNRVDVLDVMVNDLDERVAALEGGQ